MSPQRIFATALLAVGIILLVIGMNSSHSAVDQISNAVSGRFTDNTTWYIVGGAAASIIGASLMVFGGPRGKNA